MGIKDVLGSVFGFVKGLLPNVMKLGEALTLLLGIIKIGVAERDVEKIREVAQIGADIGRLFMQMGQEMVEFFDRLAEAVADEGEGGRDITGNEIRELADEGDDVAPVAAQIGVETTRLVSKVRGLL